MPDWKPAPIDLKYHWLDCSTSVDCPCGKTTEIILIDEEDDCDHCGRKFRLAAHVEMKEADEQTIGGINLGGGLLLAPHPCSAEHAAIHDQPLTVDNYEAKVKAIREMCLEWESENRQVWSAGMAMDIMCILKYGPGFDSYRAAVNKLFQPATRPWWRFWGKRE